MEARRRRLKCQVKLIPRRQVDHTNVNSCNGTFIAGSYSDMVVESETLVLSIPVKLDTGRNIQSSAASIKCEYAVKCDEERAEGSSGSPSAASCNNETKFPIVVQPTVVNDCPSVYSPKNGLQAIVTEEEQDVSPQSKTLIHLGKNSCKDQPPETLNARRGLPRRVKKKPTLANHVYLRQPKHKRVKRVTSRTRKHNAELVEQDESTCFEDPAEPTTSMSDDDISADKLRKILQRRRPVSWSSEDNERFYEALRTYGTDFSMIAEFAFAGSRTRRELKAKFIKEDRDHFDFITTCLLSSSETE